MKNSLILVLTLFLGVILNLTSQELNAEVKVDFAQVQGSNVQVFRTLEKTLKDFINNTKWTQKTVQPFERINCSFYILINDRQTVEDFKASLLVQSNRPVYGTTYYTPILNLNDREFSFKYQEFEPLIFNERKFSGRNLTDVIAFYVYIILGYDADTFLTNGGEDYFKMAKQIADNSINQGFEGWEVNQGPRKRGQFIAEILRPQNKTLRNFWYSYHRRGLDTMTQNEVNAKTSVYSAIMTLNEFRSSFQLYPLDLIFDAKKQEILDMFTGGQPAPVVDISKLKELLNAVSPLYSTDYWEKLKR